MDFTSLPPEVNSARMYVGPGSAPMLAAAAAWDALASDLYSTASSYQSVVSMLTAGPWLGPAAASMVDAAAPYVAWTRTTATQAEQTANQARAAATAYETAFAETVPPPVVAANRSLLLALVAMNLFGQNTAAIAATEAQYAQMWAQDTGAMLGYASASSSATTLTPFASPSSNTDTGGSVGPGGRGRPGHRRLRRQRARRRFVDPAGARRGAQRADRNGGPGPRPRCPDPTAVARLPGGPQRHFRRPRDCRRRDSLPTQPWGPRPFPTTSAVFTRVSTPTTSSVAGRAYRLGPAWRQRRRRHFR